ncbi:MAG: hypothetical protein ACKVRP_09410 [Bacteroidota bacterium]
MKTTIASVLVRNAIEHVSRSFAASTQTDIQEEVCNSIGAHLNIALAIEGIGNEIGDACIGASLWNRIEKSDTLVKWYLLSTVEGRRPFAIGEEPLQTIHHLLTVRNRIAHPKVEDFGDEVIIQTQNGTILRSPPSDYVLQEGDKIHVGFGKLSDEFNLKTSIAAVGKGIAAIMKLRNHLSISGLGWIDQMDKKLMTISTCVGNVKTLKPS